MRVLVERVRSQQDEQIATDVGHQQREQDNPVKAMRNLELTVEESVFWSLTNECLGWRPDRVRPLSTASGRSTAPAAATSELPVQMRFEKPNVFVHFARDLGEQIGGVLVTPAFGCIDGRA